MPAKTTLPEYSAQLSAKEIIGLRTERNELSQKLDTERNKFLITLAPLIAKTEKSSSYLRKMAALNEYRGCSYTELGLGDFESYITAVKNFIDDIEEMQQWAQRTDPKALCNLKDDQHKFSKVTPETWDGHIQKAQERLKSFHESVERYITKIMMPNHIREHGAYALPEENSREERTIALKLLLEDIMQEMQADSRLSGMFRQAEILRKSAEELHKADAKIDKITKSIRHAVGSRISSDPDVVKTAIKEAEARVRGRQQGK